MTVSQSGDSEVSVFLFQTSSHQTVCFLLSFFIICLLFSWRWMACMESLHLHWPLSPTLSKPIQHVLAFWLADSGVGRGGWEKSLSIMRPLPLTVTVSKTASVNKPRCKICETPKMLTFRLVQHPPWRQAELRYLQVCRCHSCNPRAAVTTQRPIWSVQACCGLLDSSPGDANAPPCISCIFYLPGWSLLVKPLGMACFTCALMFAVAKDCFCLSFIMTICFLAQPGIGASQHHTVENLWLE